MKGVVRRRVGPGQRYQAGSDYWNYRMTNFDNPKFTSSTYLRQGTILETTHYGQESCILKASFKCKSRNQTLLLIYPDRAKLNSQGKEEDIYAFA